MTYTPGVNTAPVPGPAAITTWGGGREDVFWIGSDTTLYHAWSPDFGTTWRREPLFSGFLVGSQPSAVAAAPGRIDVALIGANRDVEHVWYDVAYGFRLEKMASWDPAGFTVADQPELQGVAISSPWPERVDLFFLTSDRVLHHRWTDHGWRVGNEPLYGDCATPPNAAAMARNRIDVVCANSNHTIDHLYYEPGAGWSSWGTIEYAWDPNFDCYGPNSGLDSTPGQVQNVYSSPAVFYGAVNQVWIVFLENNTILHAMDHDPDFPGDNWFTSYGINWGYPWGTNECDLGRRPNLWTLNSAYTGAFSVAAAAERQVYSPKDHQNYDVANIVVLGSNSVNGFDRNEGYLETTNLCLFDVEPAEDIVPFIEDPICITN